jgi:hypothetical protein
MSDRKIRPLLRTLRELIVARGDGKVYGDLERAIRDVDSILSATDLYAESDRVKLLVAPTGNLQDLSIECGWGDEFLDLARQLEGELPR